MAVKRMKRRVASNKDISGQTAPEKNNIKKDENKTEVSNPVTAASVREWYEKNKKRIENFDAANNALKQLRDVTQTGTKTISSFSKDSLRSYLQNIGANEKNLRNLSRYLYYRCHAYYRLVMYNANMFCLDARSVIPNYDLVQGGDADGMLRSYQDTLTILDKLNLQYEFLKMYALCFREDVAYGCAYYDETGFFILPLDPDYCKISGVYYTGDFSFHMDMSYFRSRQTLLEMYGEPFQSMWNAYQSDTQNGRWQPMPDEYAVCLKARAEDWETILPVFSGLLSGIINLIDLDDIQAIANEQDIYKMIWLEMETLTNADMPDEWKVDPDIMIRYFNRMINDALPEYVSAAIVPGKLDTISFDYDRTTDTNKVSKATETLFNSSGGAQVLNSSTVSGTTAFEAAIKADTELAISMLLPQTQSWVNRFLSYQVSTPAKVKFFEVSVYTKEAFKKSMLEAAQYGLPTKLAYNTLNGFSELDTLALNFLEEEVLKVSEKFVPLQSSYTQSSESEAGRPIEDDAGDTADESKEKRDTSKG